MFYLLKVLLLMTLISYCAAVSFRLNLREKIGLKYGNTKKVGFHVPSDLKVISDENASNLMDSWWLSLSRNNSILCKCGTYSTIQSGLEAWAEENITSISYYPWSVSLVAAGEKYAFCGGTLVNDRFVLTAASCVDGSLAKEVEVLIGSWPMIHMSNVSDNIDRFSSKPLQRKKVIRIILHPKYKHLHLDNNVALLRLKGPVFGFGDSVTPVCLPKMTEDFGAQLASSLLWRFHQQDGMVVPVRRSEVTWQILSQKQCQLDEYGYPWTQMPETLICAETEKPSLDHPFYESYDCPGDSGGPLVVTQGNQKIQIGVDSWTGCGKKLIGIGLFNRITEFLQWINLHIEHDGRHCRN